MKCSECGSSLADDAAFCSRCGAPQSIVPDDELPDDDSPVGVTRARAANARRTGGGGARQVEEELWSGTYSPLAMVGPAIGCAIVSVIVAVAVAMFSPDATGALAFGIALVLIWGLFALTLLYRRWTVRYRLTTYRFFHDVGLLSRTANRIEVIDIDDVTVHQGLVERMFGVGTIHIDSSDATHPDLDLPGIEDVRSVADLIDGTRRAERHRRGLHLETI